MHTFLSLKVLCVHIYSPPLHIVDENIVVGGTHTNVCVCVWSARTCVDLSSGARIHCLHHFCYTFTGCVFSSVA